jgi:predicted permease
MLFDLRVAARLLRARPLFTIVAILTLAIGIGSNAAVFSVINTVLLRPLPYAQPEGLVSLYSRYLPSSGYDYSYFSLSGPEFADIRGRVAGFSAVAAYDFSFRNMTVPRGQAERVLTMEVTADFFRVLGVEPERGRTFSESEAQRGETCVAIVSSDLSNRAFANADPPGSAIRLDDAACEVVGVMPQGFGFRDDRVKVWTNLAIDATETPVNRASHPLMAIARLGDGVAVGQVDAQLQSLRAYWSERYPDHYAKGHFAVLRSLHEDIVGDQRPVLRLLGGAVAFVLLIVCVNLAALLVSRGEARRREFALRRALGADRRRLLAQLLGETMMLAAIGGALGLVLANWMLEALLTLYPERLPAPQPVTIDYWAMLFSLALTVITGFLVGLVPAWHATGVRLHETLKAEARATTAARGTIAARSGLVVAQLALSIVVLTGTLLLVRTYQHLQRVDLGIDIDRVLTFTVSLPETRQPDEMAARRTLSDIATSLAALPDVETAGAIANLPLLSAGPPDDFVIEGRQRPAASAPAWNARYVLLTPRVFGALRIPLKRGRLLNESDTAGQPLVAVINETAARMYWPNDDPVGRTIRYYPQETSPSIRIVGIVGDVKSIGAHAPAPPALYAPYAQASRFDYDQRSMTFVVRTRGNPLDVAASARAAVASIDSALPVADMQPMAAIARAATGEPRFATIVMSFFGIVACFLATLGLYGILAYSVEQRVREIGVRVALGADRRAILRLFISNGVRLAARGIAMGIPAALVLTRVLRGLLSGVTTSDPLTYAVVVGIFAITAFVASYLPARRATRLDPVVALRAE